MTGKTASMAPFPYLDWVDCEYGAALAVHLDDLLTDPVGRASGARPLSNEVVVPADNCVYK